MFVLDDEIHSNGGRVSISHSVEDAEREHALSKLSDREKKLLGIK